MRAGVTTISHAWLEVSEDVAQYVFASGKEKEFEAFMDRAREGNVAAGSDTTSKVEFWAEFHSFREADECVKRMKQVHDAYMKMAAMASAAQG